MKIRFWFFFPSWLHFYLSHDREVLLTTWEAQAAVVFTMAVFLVQVHLDFLLLHAPLIIIVVFEVPNGRPAIFPKIFLIFRVKQLQRFGRVAANAVVIDAQVRHAPFSELMRVVKLRNFKLKVFVSTFFTFLPSLARVISNKVQQLHLFHSAKPSSSLQSHDTRWGSAVSASTSDSPAQEDSSICQRRLVEFHRCIRSKEACGMCIQSRRVNKSKMRRTLNLKTNED